MPRRRFAAIAAVLALTCAAVVAPSVDADAASGQKVLILQLNAAEGTDTCNDPSTQNCLAAASGNTGRDMYAVEEVCRTDYLRFKRAHAHWAVLFSEQTVSLHAPKNGQCKYKGDMLASPRSITNRKTYTLSSGFTYKGIKHDYRLVCGLIHAAVAFYGCSTHLVFPRPDKSRAQVHNLIKDTAGYRSFGRVVIAGDFNIAESGAGAGATPRLKPIVKAGFSETDKDKTATHGTRKFDYIFYFSKTGVRQRAALTGPVATSDHKVLLGEAVI